MRSGIQGVWTLRSFHMEDVETRQQSEPFGPAPRGTLIFHADGRMAAILTPGGRTASAGAVDRAEAAGKLVAYSGRYRLEAPDRLVTAVDVASFEDWIGTDQVRTYRLDGDRLELVTPPGRMPRPDGGEATVFAVLSWRREAPLPVEAPDRALG